MYLDIDSSGNQDITRNFVAADAGPGPSAATFAEMAPVLHEQGYNTLPIIPGEKRPPKRLRWQRWQNEPQRTGIVTRWAHRYSAHWFGPILRGDFVHIDGDTPQTFRLIQDIPSAWDNPNSLDHPGGGGALIRVPDLPRRNLVVGGVEVRTNGYVVLSGRRSLHGLDHAGITRVATTLTMSAVELAELLHVNSELFASRDTSTLDTKFKFHELSIKSGGVTLIELFSDAAAVRRAAVILGVPSPRLGKSFRCILPGHAETSPSAVLGRNLRGAYVYFDHHLHDALSDGRPRFVVTLPEVRASLAYGYIPTLGAPELATWGLRLLVEAGVLEPADVGMPPLPSWVADPIRRVYDGFRLLLGCRWLHTHGAPAPFTWDFARAWCGRDLSRKDVGAAILHLRHEGLIRFFGQHKLANLFLPGGVQT